MQYKFTIRPLASFLRTKPTHAKELATQKTLCSTTSPDSIFKNNIMSDIQRCFWCDQTAIYQHYHDTEWGFPVSEDKQLFEKISLEGFQAGLSWLTILKKRPAFRSAFEGFDFHTLANWGEADVERLLKDEGIVRHRGKIEAVLNNARRAVALQAEYGSLAAYFWQHEAATHTRPALITPEFLRTQTQSPESLALSKDLKKRGWKFVGPTTLYAFMQAMGLVNDHESACHARVHVESARKAFTPPSPI